MKHFAVARSAEGIGDRRAEGGEELTRSVYGITDRRPPPLHHNPGLETAIWIWYNIYMFFVCHPVNSTVISGRHTYNGTAPSTTNGYVRAETCM